MGSVFWGLFQRGNDLEGAVSADEIILSYSIFTLKREDVQMISSGVACLLMTGQKSDLEGLPVLHLLHLLHISTWTHCSALNKVWDEPAGSSGFELHHIVMIRG